MTESYRIGEVAAETGVSVDAVRYYERIGLLPQAARARSGNRRYACDAVARIRFIKQAQANGLTLAEIRELLSLKERGASHRCERVQRLLAAKIKDIDQQRAQLDEFRQTLQAYADQCGQSLREAADPECPVFTKIGEQR